MYLRSCSSVCCCARPVIVLCVLLAVASVAPGAILEFNLDTLYNSLAPQGPLPWLNATFTDVGQPAGTVELTLTATNLVNAEFVGGWYLNLDPAFDPCLLVFSAVTKTGKFGAPTILLGSDAFQADGDGMFDILLDFATGGGANARFGVADAAMYTITYTGAGSITPYSFDFPSVEGGGQGEYPTAAHVQGIGDFSGWITVPEPTAVCLFATGALLLRKRRRH